jgi:hypothetical protein
MRLCRIWSRNAENSPVLFAFGLSAKLMPQALEILFPYPTHHCLLNFLTTFWQLFATFWQLFDSFLTTFWHFFDNFVSTFSQLFGNFFDNFLTINFFTFWHYVTLTHLWHHKSSNSLDPQMTAEGMVGAPTCLWCKKRDKSHVFSWFRHFRHFANWAFWLMLTIFSRIVANKSFLANFAIFSLAGS